ncbi:transcriptional regulator [Streptomyces sp. NPDC047079]|uniref:transcriptional regulator n=1 Tax=Streptomyces sp. NPDC047079 TaxID=3154607 RepID=UPI0033E889E1
MRMVATPVPPPLPVRQRTQIPSGGLSPMLGRLAAERATGVLMREGGLLHLVDGQVVYAESPATPGLDALLIAHGALDEDCWREAVAEAGTRRRVGRFLVDSGRISEGALELCHLGALYDAAYFVLGPSSAPARFRYGEAHWLGAVHPVPVAGVERETLRRRELLRRIWPDPATDEAPLVRTDRQVGPAVTPRQAEVLDRIDGVRTAADISRALGRPAFHTLVDVRRLAAAGAVTARPAPSPVPAPGPVPAWGPVPAPAPAPDPASGAAPGSDSDVGPASRTPSSADERARPAHQDPLPPFADPHITLLKRLRDALEAL